MELGDMAGPMGYGRGGWYTPQQVNLLASRGRCSAKGLGSPRALG